jgi:hypothetical protein
LQQPGKSRRVRVRVGSLWNPDCSAGDEIKCASQGTERVVSTGGRRGSPDLLARINQAPVALRGKMNLSNPDYTFAGIHPGLPYCFPGCDSNLPDSAAALLFCIRPGAKEPAGPGSGKPFAAPVRAPSWPAPSSPFLFRGSLPPTRYAAPSPARALQTAKTCSLDRGLPVLKRGCLTGFCT